MFWQRNSLVAGADGQINHMISVLRRRHLEGPLKDDLRLIPGCQLHADPQLGLTGSYRSPKGRVLEIDAQMTGPGGWCALHIDLPARDLGVAEVLGFLCRAAAPEDQILRACLRSGTDKGFVDTFFDKHLLLYSEVSVHLDAITVPLRPDLPQIAPWRQLILFLPTQSFRATLHDLRVFVI